MKVIKQLAVIGLVCISTATIWPQFAAGQGDQHSFPETKHTVKGIFWKYWQEHGGLAQQGYPLSEEFTEVSDLDGKSYMVQYFERAVFEQHVEYKPPYDVLLSQLGTFQYKSKYGDAGATGQKPNTQNSQLFKETGFQAGGAFLEYWKAHGGLAQQGFPISNEFSEVSDLDGKTYTVQYFERAVFEQHAENKPPFDVLLSQLGTFQMRKKHPGGVPGGGSTPQPTQPTQPATQPTRTQAVGQPTRTPTGTNCEAVPASKQSGVSSTGAVAISDVKYSGLEYVVITNRSNASIDIGGWVLRDKNDPQQRFAFPGGTQLPGGGSVQVYTEAGHPYSFNSKSSIWNNCGDALELLNVQGAVVATYAYGTHLMP